jgi:hypothetical protein
MGMVRGSAGRVFDHRIRGVEGAGVTRQPFGAGFRALN